MLLNNQWVTEGIKEEIKNTFRQMKWKHNAKPLGHRKSRSTWEVYKYYKGLYQKTRKKISISNLIFHLKDLEIEEKAQPKLAEGRG